MVDKVKENLLRRMAKRQGLELIKSKRRDHRAIDYGAYWLFDPYNKEVVYGAGLNDRPAASAEEIEAYLTTDPVE